MQHFKSPGNDGLTKEFYEYFWNVIKDPLMNSIKVARKNKKLSISQRQVVIKLIEKKVRDKLYIKNWRPISLPNVDYKIMSKALATRLKEILPDLISRQQTAHVKNKYIGEGGRLISDILEINNTFNLRGYILTVDIEKAFDSLCHSFLLPCLKKLGFGYDFIRWVTILVESQESHIINAGITMSYFSLEKGTRQDDPVSAYLFNLCLEVLFLFVKANHKIRDVNIFQYTYLYTAYADDTTFFLKNKHSIRQLMESFSTYLNILV